MEFLSTNWVELFLNNNFPHPISILHHIPHPCLNPRPATPSLATVPLPSAFPPLLPLTSPPFPFLPLLLRPPLASPSFLTPPSLASGSNNFQSTISFIIGLTFEAKKEENYNLILFYFALLSF